MRCSLDTELCLALPLLLPLPLPLPYPYPTPTPTPNQVRVHDKGTCKFVPKVQEVHFSGPKALAAGKKCFYATHL